MRLHACIAESQRRWAEGSKDMARDVKGRGQPVAAPLELAERFHGLLKDLWAEVDSLCCCDQMCSLTDTEQSF